jgi:hypothetical protein
MMDDSNATNVFDDFMQGLHEIEEHQKGNLQLRTHTVTISDDELDSSLLIYQKLAGMSEIHKQRVAGYVDGLLQASGQ